MILTGLVGHSWATATLDPRSRKKMLRARMQQKHLTREFTIAARNPRKLCLCDINVGMASSPIGDGGFRLAAQSRPTMLRACSSQARDPHAWVRFHPAFTESQSNFRASRWRQRSAGLREAIRLAGNESVAVNCPSEKSEKRLLLMLSSCSGLKPEGQNCFADTRLNQPH
jgi:hypothetical protein